MGWVVSCRHDRQGRWMGMGQGWGWGQFGWWWGVVVMR